MLQNCGSQTSYGYMKCFREFGDKMHGGKLILSQFSCEGNSSSSSDHPEDLGIDGKLILEWILEK
jgi:hypothetical protein